MMNRMLFPIFTILVFLSTACNSPVDKNKIPDPQPVAYEYALVLHGGAGSMNFENLPEPRQQQYKHALDSALQLGLDLLKKGEASIHAVEHAVAVDVAVRHRPRENGQDIRRRYKSALRSGGRAFEAHERRSLTPG